MAPVDGAMSPPPCTPPPPPLVAPPARARGSGLDSTKQPYDAGFFPPPPPPLLSPDGQRNHILVILWTGDGGAVDEASDSADRVFALLPSNATVGDLRRRSVPPEELADFSVSFADGVAISDERPLRQLLLLQSSVPAEQPKSVDQAQLLRRVDALCNKLKPVSKAAGATELAAMCGAAFEPFYHGNDVAAGKLAETQDATAAALMGASAVLRLRCASLPSHHRLEVKDDYGDACATRVPSIRLESSQSTEEGEDEHLCQRRDPEMAAVKEHSGLRRENILDGISGEPVDPTISGGATGSRAELNNGSTTSALLEYCRELLFDQNSADVLLVAGDAHGSRIERRVPGHRLVLSRLPFFQRLLNRAPAPQSGQLQVEVVIPGVPSVDALRRVIRFAYTDDAVAVVAAVQSHRALAELLVAADACALPQLRKECDQRLGATTMRSQISPKDSDQASSSTATTAATTAAGATPRLASPVQPPRNAAEPRRSPLAGDTLRRGDILAPLRGETPRRCSPRSGGLPPGCSPRSGGLQSARSSGSMSLWSLGFGSGSDGGEAAAVESIQHLGAELQSQLAEIERLRYLLRNPREAQQHHPAAASLHTMTGNKECEARTANQERAGVASSVDVATQGSQSSAAEKAAEALASLGPTPRGENGQHGSVAAEVSRQVRKLRKSLRDELVEQYGLDRVPVSIGATTASSETGVQSGSASAVSSARAAAMVVNDASEIASNLEKPSGAASRDRVHDSAASMVIRPLSPSALASTSPVRPLSPPMRAPRCPSMAPPRCGVESSSRQAVITTNARAFSPTVLRPSVIRCRSAPGSAAGPLEVAAARTMPIASCPSISPPPAVARPTATQPALSVSYTRRYSAPSSPPVLRRSTSLVHRRSSAPSHHFFHSSRTSTPRSVTPRQSPRSATHVPMPPPPAVSPPRRLLVGPFPQVTWAYYEVPEPVRFPVPP